MQCNARSNVDDDPEQTNCTGSTPAGPLRTRLGNFESKVFDAPPPLAHVAPAKAYRTGGRRVNRSRMVTRGNYSEHHPFDQKIGCEAICAARLC